MKRSSLLLIGAFAAALIYLGLSHRALERRLEGSEAALARALAQQRSIDHALRACEATLDAAADAPRAQPPAGDACDCASACPDAIELTLTPEGDLLKSPEEREAYVRAHLERRIAAAFPEEEMDERTREQALELLVRIRALRGARDGERGRPDALGDAEEDFIDLTGMGVGELLAQIHTRQPVRDPGSEASARLLEEEPAKRFASFRCQQCKAGWEALERLRRRWSDALVIDFHHDFPDEPLLWFEDALAAECSARQNRLADYAAWRFSDAYDGDSPVTAPALDADAAKSCMDDPRTAVGILEDTEEALRQGFRDAMPSWIIGRTPRRGFQSDAILDETIRAERAARACAETLDR